MYFGIRTQLRQVNKLWIICELIVGKRVLEKSSCSTIIGFMRTSIICGKYMWQGRPENLQKNSSLKVRMFS